MIKLDTVKIQIPMDAVKSIDKSKFTETVTTDLSDSGIKQSKWELKPQYKSIGLGIVQVNLKYDSVIVEFSAKILLEKYFEGVTLETIFQVVDSIKNGIEFYPEKLIESATVLKCDCTDNLKMEYEPSIYIDDLSLFRINSKYKIDEYQNNASIVFTKDVITKAYKERMTLYDKYYEITNKDKRICDILHRAGKLNQFKNILRVENNISSFRKMRELFGIVSMIQPGKDAKLIYLSDVLKSKERVNLKSFKQITEKNIPEIFYKYENTNIKFSQILKLEGVNNVILDCNYDIRLIKKFIRLYVKGNISRYVKEFKGYIADIKTGSANSPENKSRIESNIREIAEKLAV